MASSEWSMTNSAPEKTLEPTIRSQFMDATDILARILKVIKHH